MSEVDGTLRWDNLLYPNHTSGVWADANRSHRYRNRPVTYVPYWYLGYEFLGNGIIDGYPTDPTLAGF